MKTSPLTVKRDSAICVACFHVTVCFVEIWLNLFTVEEYDLTTAGLNEDNNIKTTRTAGM